MEAADTVEDVQTKIQDKQGTPPDRRRLTRAGKHSEEAGRAISDDDITEESTLHVAAGARGGAHPKGNTILLCALALGVAVVLGGCAGALFAPPWVAPAAAGSSSWPRLRGAPLSVARDGEAHNIVFVKTHSTGSSTLTGVFHRYCDGHAGIYCFVYPKGTFAGRTVSVKLLQSWFHRMRGEPLNIWPNHVEFEPSIFDQWIPHNVKVSIFREPLSRVLSSYRHGSLEQLQRDFANLKRGELPQEVCGRQSGMPTTSHIKIEYFKTLDVVLLTEEYDLSLMMLRRRLGWRLSDMLYMPLKSHPTSQKFGDVLSQFSMYLSKPEIELTAAARAYVSRCLKGDEAKIYQMAKESFQDQLRDGGAELRRDVELFGRLRQRVTYCCEQHGHDDSYCIALLEDNMAWNRRHQKYAPVHSLWTDSACRKLALQED